MEVLLSPGDKIVLHIKNTQSRIEVTIQESPDTDVSISHKVDGDRRGRPAYVLAHSWLPPKVEKL